MTENKSVWRFPAIGGPNHGTHFKFDKSVGDLPLVIPFEDHGGVYVYRGDTYIWDQVD